MRGVSERVVPQFFHRYLPYDWVMSKSRSVVATVVAALLMLSPFQATANTLSEAQAKFSALQNSLASDTRIINQDFLAREEINNKCLADYLTDTSPEGSQKREECITAREAITREKEQISTRIADTNRQLSILAAEIATLQGSGGTSTTPSASGGATTTPAVPTATPTPAPATDLQTPGDLAQPVVPGASSSVSPTAPTARPTAPTTTANSTVTATKKPAVAVKKKKKKKMRTITCTKGKKIRKVTAVKPICPKGFKVRVR